MTGVVERGRGGRDDIHDLVRREPVGGDHQVGVGRVIQNSALVLSIGVFFSLMILGLAASLPGTMQHGPVAQGVSPEDAHRIS